MKHDVFAKWLKALIIGTTLIGIAGLFTIVPFISNLLRFQYPQAEQTISVWTILIYLFTVPCFVAMGLSWKIASQIQKGHYFCTENGRLFALFSKLALGDSVLFLLASIVFYTMGMNHIGFLVLSLLVAFIGLAIGICTAALSYFTNSAAILQEDSDLTI